LFEGDPDQDPDATRRGIVKLYLIVIACPHFVILYNQFAARYNQAAAGNAKCRN
jgi:hypothetical protein